MSSARARHPADDGPASGVLFSGLVHKLPAMPRPNEPDGTKDSSAHLGFEATARRGSANHKGEAIPRSLEGNLWLSADNPEDKDEPSGTNRVERDTLLKAAGREHAAACGKQPAAGRPQGEHGSAKQYLAANVFWVPVDARWPQLQSRAKLPSIGKDVDDAMVALERDNPRLKGALNKNYGRADLDTAQRVSAFSPRGATSQSLCAAKDNHRLGELIDLIGSIQLAESRAERDRLPKATRRVNAGAFINSASRPRATPASPGCSTSSTTSPSTVWRASSSPMAACRPTSPAKATSGKNSSRPTSWTAWSPSLRFSYQCNSLLTLLSTKL